MAALAAVYLAAITSTHAALSTDSPFWWNPVPGASAGLTQPTAAEYESYIFPTTQRYRDALWANRPGAEIAFGFTVHNGGPSR